MKANTKKMICLGVLAAGAGMAYLALRKPSVGQATMGAFVGLQVLARPNQALLCQPNGNVTTYGYIYEAPNPMVAIGRLRGLALAGSKVAPDGEPYLAFSAP